MARTADQWFEGLERWQAEAQALRAVLANCDLSEEIKWAKPCYGRDGNNLCIVQPFRDMLALMFFKGALLEDPDALLKEQGENSHSAKRLEFRTVGEVKAAADAIRDFVAQAAEAERKGLKVERPEDEVPEELIDALDTDPELREAFDALTPGRKRGYYLTIGEPKKPETRRARIEKHRPRILAGKGIHDR